MPRGTQPFCTGALSATLPFQILLVVVEVLYGRTQVYEAPQLRSVQFRRTRISCPMQHLGPATPTLTWTLCCGGPDAELGGCPNGNLVAHLCLLINGQQTTSYVKHLPGGCLSDHVCAVTPLWLSTLS